MTTDRTPTLKPASEAGAGPSRPKPALVRVLVADDDMHVRRAVVRMLRASGIEAVEAADGEAALQRLQAGDIDVLLADIMMPRMDGMQLLRVVRERNLGVEVVMMTAHGDVSMAVEAVRAGAYNFLKKPFTSNEEVVLAVNNATDHRRLLERTRTLEAQLIHQQGLGQMIGSSPAMQEVYRKVLNVAPGPTPVLILGESGTGKELIAQEIHARSSRSAKAFVAVNLGTLTEQMMVDELFGHVKGAYTGADRDRPGLFEAADGGTIFLDEVGELPLVQQPALLRVLQEREVRRTGANSYRSVDVRVIAATNVDLGIAVRDRRFRDDLYFRLNVVTIPLPPLRERREDIAELAFHFLKTSAGRLQKDVRRIDPRAVHALESYAWPGNVRELQNAVESAVVHAQGDTVTADLLPDALRALAGPSLVPAGATVPAPPAGDDGLVVLDYNAAKKRALADFERTYVQAILARSDGNISKAARLANLDRSNFKRVMRRALRGEGVNLPDDEGDEDAAY